MEKSYIKIAETSLLLLEKKSWKDLSLTEIRKKSKIKNFDKLIDKKKIIIKIINEYFDYSLSLFLENIEKSDNKDMIFEIIMMRFDILQKNRKAIISIYNSFKSKPQDLLFLLPHIIDSIILMTEPTNISLRGISGQLKIKGILIIYIISFLTWIEDETSSIEKTMITLDKSLDQAGNIVRFLK